MRLRLLLILLVSIAGMGADCGGGSGGAATESSAFATTAKEGGEDGGGDYSQPVPEPSALLVFGTGLAIAALATRRRS